MSEQQKTWIENYNDYLDNDGIYPNHIVAVFEIINDLRDRAGLADEWDMIDEEIQGEIIESWIGIVEKKMGI